MGDTRMLEDGTVALFTPLFIGLAWHAFKLALVGGGLASTISTRQQNEGKPENIFFCIVGVVSTILGVGGEAAAAKKFAESKGYFGVAANAWMTWGLESIELNVFNRRGIDAASGISQRAHSHFVYDALRRRSAGEVEFVGYAPDSHKLMRRESTVRPLAPMFRFKHHKYGMMEPTSRDTGENGMHFTISYAGHPTHHASQEKRDEYFQHERPDQHQMEARFDQEASNSDPGDISFDGAGGFDQNEKQVECFTGTEWNEGNVLSVQMYDKANEATFGYASVGSFPDNSVDSGLQDFGPQGLPLTGGQDC